MTQCLYQCTCVALLWVKVIALCAPSVYKISGPKFRSCKIYQISCLTSDTSCAEKEANPHWSDLRQMTKSSPRVKLTGAGQWPILKDSFLALYVVDSVSYSNFELNFDVSDFGIRIWKPANMLWVVWWADNRAVVQELVSPRSKSWCDWDPQFLGAAGRWQGSFLWPSLDSYSSLSPAFQTLLSSTLVMFVNLDQDQALSSNTKHQRNQEKKPKKNKLSLSVLWLLILCRSNIKNEISGLPCHTPLLHHHSTGEMLREWTISPRLRTSTFPRSSSSSPFSS